MASSATPAGATWARVLLPCLLVLVLVVQVKTQVEPLATVTCSPGPGNDITLFDAVHCAVLIVSQISAPPMCQKDCEADGCSDIYNAGSVGVELCASNCASCITSIEAGQVMSQIVASCLPSLISGSLAGASANFTLNGQNVTMKLEAY
ncbi:unnamed protein product [Calypogeia fissa]